MNKLRHYILSILFIGIITTPSLLLVLNKLGLSELGYSSSAINENRKLASWPSLTIADSDFDQYTSQINGFLEDHFSFRQTLLKASIRARFELLNLLSDKQVTIGKDDWLFLTSGVSNAIGLNKQSNKYLSEWAKQALVFKNHVEANGGVFLIVFPPDKPQLYSENLHVQFNHTPEQRLLERLKPFLDNLNVDYIDLLDVLTEHKKESPTPLLYSRTDTHWTHKGAFKGYEAIVGHLNENGNSLPILDRNQLIKKESPQFVGDLAKMVGIESKFNETAEFIHLKSSSKMVKPDKSLLLYGDSFSAHLKRFFRFSFRSQACFHHQVARPDLQHISTEKPDFVIFEIIERSITRPLIFNTEENKRCPS